jgi:hypothetical protein
LVGTVGPGREADDITRVERLLPTRAPDHHLPRQGNQHLFVGPLDVIRADLRTGWQVVDAQAKFFRAELRSDTGGSTLIARCSGGNFIGLAVEEIERLQPQTLAPVLSDCARAAKRRAMSGHRLRQAPEIIGRFARACARPMPRSSALAMSSDAEHCPTP